MKNAAQRIGMIGLLVGLVGLKAGCAVSGKPQTPDAHSPDQDPAAKIRQPVQVSEQARRIHASAIVIDGHNDLPGQIRELADSSFDELDLAKPQPKLHTDIPRLRAGGVGAQFWSAYVPPELDVTGGAARYCLEQIDLIHRMVRRYPDDFEMAYTADDVVRIHSQGKIASLIGIEGGHAIENSLAVVRMYYELGARYITLTHSDTHDWADSATDEPRHGGLSPLGEQVVLQMNQLGMFVDISHISAEAMRDVLRVSQAPVIASHSSAFALAAHPRNVPDDVLQSVADNGGVIMVNFYPGFIDAQAAKLSLDMFAVWRRIKKQYPDEEERNNAMQAWDQEHPLPTTSVHTVVDHIDHIVKTAGIDHVGLGSDYDGVTSLPEQLEDVSCFPVITQVLLDRGYSESDIHKILGGNLLRAMRQAESVAANWPD